jgi:hypothetical protein
MRLYLLISLFLTQALVTSAEQTFLSLCAVGKLSTKQKEDRTALKVLKFKRS